MSILMAFEIFYFEDKNQNVRSKKKIFFFLLLILHEQEWKHPTLIILG